MGSRKVYLDRFGKYLVWNQAKNHKQPGYEARYNDTAKMSIHRV